MLELSPEVLQLLLKIDDLVGLLLLLILKTLVVLGFDFELSLDDSDASDETGNSLTIGLVTSLSGGKGCGCLIKLLLDFSLRSALILKLGLQQLNSLVVVRVVFLTLGNLVLQSFSFNFVCLSSFFKSLGQIIGLGLLNGQVTGELLDFILELISLGLGSVKLMAASVEVGVQRSESLPWLANNQQIQD